MSGDVVNFLHPLTPPLTEEDRISWLRLLRSRRVGVATFFRLMHEHGSAQAALKVLPEIAAAAGVTKYATCSENAAQDEYRRARLAGATPIFFGSPEYPEILAQIDDPPPILWHMGRRDVLDRPMVALVGARNASSLGTRMAKTLAQGLAQAGCVVVSGLARGIDTAAHVGALSGGTVAVTGGGVDVVYPAENAVLYQEILQDGARLSEQPMGLQPMARHFPRRNRLISGLARVTVVVEAAARSGSLMTARCALDQGREVCAVPGHPFDGRATGCNFLIRDGATLVQSVDHVLDVLRAAQSRLPLPPVDGPAPNTPRSAADTAALHTEILDRLGPSPMPEDQLIRDLKARANDVGSELAALEIDGKIQRQPGGLVSLLN